MKNSRKKKASSFRSGGPLADWFVLGLNWPFVFSLAPGSTQLIEVISVPPILPAPGVPPSPTVFEIQDIDFNLDVGGGPTPFNNSTVIGMYKADFDDATNAFSTRNPGIVPDVNREDWIGLQSMTHRCTNAISTIYNGRRMSIRHSSKMRIGDGKALFIAVSNVGTSSAADTYSAWVRAKIVRLS